MFYLRDYIEDNILKKAVSLIDVGSAELAWDKQSALKIIISIDKAPIGILGGGVCEIVGNDINITYDSWYTNRNMDETDEHFFRRGKAEARNYIENYPIKNEKILFTISFSCLVNFSPQEE